MKNGLDAKPPPTHRQYDDSTCVKRISKGEAQISSGKNDWLEK